MESFRRKLGGLRGVADQGEDRRFWMSDEVAINCSDCEVKFTLINRRHHCRVCGQIFCSACSQFSVPGSSVGMQAANVRACRRCHQQLESSKEGNAGLTSKVSAKTLPTTLNTSTAASLTLSYARTCSGQQSPVSPGADSNVTSNLKFPSFSGRSPSSPGCDRTGPVGGHCGATAVDRSTYMAGPSTNVGDNHLINVDTANRKLSFQFGSPMAPGERGCHIDRSSSCSNILDKLDESQSPPLRHLKIDPGATKPPVPGDQPTGTRKKSGRYFGIGRFSSGNIMTGALSSPPLDLVTVAERDGDEGTTSSKDLEALLKQLSASLPLSSHSVGNRLYEPCFLGSDLVVCLKAAGGKQQLWKTGPDNPAEVAQALLDSGRMEDLVLKFDPDSRTLGSKANFQLWKPYILKKVVASDGFGAKAEPEAGLLTPRLPFNDRSDTISEDSRQISHEYESAAGGPEWFQDILTESRSSAAVRKAAETFLSTSSLSSKRLTTPEEDDGSTSNSKAAVASSLPSVARSRKLTTVQLNGSSDYNREVASPSSDDQLDSQHSTKEMSVDKSEQSPAAAAPEGSERSSRSQPQEEEKPLPLPSESSVVKQDGPTNAEASDQDLSNQQQHHGHQGQDPIELRKAQAEIAAAASNDETTVNKLDVKKIESPELDQIFYAHHEAYLQKLMEQEGLSDKWTSIVRDFSTMIVNNVHLQEGGNRVGGKWSNDVRKFVKVKRIPGGTTEDCAIVSGEVFGGKVYQTGHSVELTSPRLLLVSDKLSYPRHEKLVSMDNLQAQEREYVGCVLKKLVGAFRPDVVLAENQVCCGVREGLYEEGIALVLGVKPKVIKRLERLFDTRSVANLDSTTVKPSSSSASGAEKWPPSPSNGCARFRSASLRMEPQFDAGKDVIVLEREDMDRGCTVLLRGGSLLELTRVKRVLLRILLLKNSAKYEKSFMLTSHFQVDNFPSYDYSGCDLLNLSLSPFIVHDDEPALVQREVVATSSPRLLSSPVEQDKVLEEKILNELEAEDEAKARDDGCREGCNAFADERPRFLDVVLGSNSIGDVAPNGKGFTSHHDMVAEFRRAARVEHFSHAVERQKRVDPRKVYLRQRKVLAAATSGGPATVLPDYHRRLTAKKLPILFSCHSPLLPKQYCISPWVLQMSYYGETDFSVGFFLDEYCFSPDARCPNQDCPVGRISDHVRRIVMGETCITLQMKQVANNALASPDTVQTWRYCTACQVITPIRVLSSDASLMSCALFFAQLLCEKRLVRNSRDGRSTLPCCNHSLNAHHHVCFAKGDFLVTMKVGPVQLRGLAMPDPVIRLKDPGMAREARTAATIMTELSCLTVAGLTLFGQINEKLVKIRSEAAQGGALMSAVKQLLAQDQVQDYDAYKESVERLSQRLRAHDEQEEQQGYPRPTTTMELLRGRSDLLAFKVSVLKTAQRWRFQLHQLLELKKREDRSRTGLIKTQSGDGNTADLVATAATSVATPVAATSSAPNLLTVVTQSSQSNLSDSGTFSSSPLPTASAAGGETASFLTLTPTATSAAVEPAQLASKEDPQSGRKRHNSVNPSDFQLKSPFPTTLHPDLYLAKPGVIVDEDQPSSIIAYTLATEQHAAFVASRASDLEVLPASTPSAADEEVFDQLVSVGGSNCDPPGDRATRAAPLPSIKVDDADSVKHENCNGGSAMPASGTTTTVTTTYRNSVGAVEEKGLHFQHTFSDETCEFYCSALFAQEFEAFRKEVLAVDVAHGFVLSLAECERFVASGGKSGANFFRTKDERFLLKELNRKEVKNIRKGFAPKYMDHVRSFGNNKGSSGTATESEGFHHACLLSKILGIFEVGYKNQATGRSFALVAMVMENLNFGRDIGGSYDLKGSQRNRLVDESKSVAAAATAASPYRMGETVLMDENLLNSIRDRPFYITYKSFRRLVEAIKRDTEFLESSGTIDYSLLVATDLKTNELVLGIIDYVRGYTWDKQLEFLIKSSSDLLVVGGKRKEPTIIKPESYKDRFQEAMSNYFTPVPSYWYDLLMG